jgi:hypothetical protein
MDKYLTQSELKEIIALSEAFDVLYETMRKCTEMNIDDSLVEGFHIFDSNGEVMGTIGLTEDGTFGLFLTATEDK